MEEPRLPNSTATSREREAELEWPVLLGRTIDNFSRIVEAEIRLLGANTAAALETAVRDAVATIIVATAMLCAEGCLVAALVLLLHQWLSWWLAAAVTGALMLIIGLTVRGLLVRRDRSVQAQTPERVPVF